MKKKLFCVYQCGFTSYHSIDTCLSQLCNMILNDADSLTGMILIDLQETFEALVDFLKQRLIVSNNIS